MICKGYQSNYKLRSLLSSRRHCNEPRVSNRLSTDMWHRRRRFTQTQRTTKKTCLHQLSGATRIRNVNISGNRQCRYYLTMLSLARGRSKRHLCLSHKNNEESSVPSVVIRLIGRATHRIGLLLHLRLRCLSLMLQQPKPARALQSQRRSARILSSTERYIRKWQSSGEEGVVGCTA